MPAAPQLPEGYDPGPWAVHTRYTDPRHRQALIAAIPPDLQELSAAARNVIIHYRASGLELPEETREDPNSRWLSTILDRDQERHRAPLTQHRDPYRRVQGCCRDHSLFAAGVLRHHQVPARIRYGFVGYFVPGFHVDHVIVETWDAERRRWRRFDPEFEGPTQANPTPYDLPYGEPAMFRTAAEAWSDHRAGRIDLDHYGVDPELPIRGDWFVQGAVMFDAVFRAGYEFLIWDGWDALAGPDGPSEALSRLTDELAALVIAADNGDPAAEQALLERVRTDPAVTPPDVVETMRPWGGPTEQTDLSKGPEIPVGSQTATEGATP